MVKKIHKNLEFKKNWFIYLIFLFMNCVPGGYGLAYEVKISDGFYLTALDAAKELKLIYRGDDNKGGGILVTQTVYAIGYDENFIILKQHPWHKNQMDTTITNYYIVNLMEVREEKLKFKQKVDTVNYANVIKTNSGKDSIGKMNTSIFTTRFEPKEPKKLTLKEFEKERTRLKVSDTLSFFLNFKNEMEP